jgi:hypothetical protein
MPHLRTLLALAATTAVALAAAVPAAAANPTFAPYVSYATGGGSGPGPAPVSTVAGDFNGDGHADVATVNNFGQGDVIVMPGRGDGTFGAPFTIPGSSGVQALAAGDLDGDGHLDLVGMTSSSVVVLLGDGHGGFRLAGSYPETIGGQAEVLVSDLNHDGRPDIVELSFTTIQTLLNIGGGTFRAGPTTQVTGASVLSAVTTANLDGDAYPDLYAADGSSGTIFALRGTGTGAFTQTGQIYGSGFVPEDIKAVDLTGDGIDDVAAIDSFSFTLATALADGHGGFASGLTTVDRYSGNGPTSLGVADFNHDGPADLVVSNLANPGYTTLNLFTGNGTVSPTAAGSFNAAALSQNPAIADFNGDGRPDIAVAGPGTLSVLLNTTA